MSWIIGVISFILFLLFQAQGIVGGDSGDLVAAAATGGVPHPPGYPLYTFLGWLASHLPILSPAWRVGLLSSVSHAATIILVFEIVFLLTRKRAAGLFASLTLLGNYLFFLYSVTPEVFALLDLFVAGLLYLAIRFIQTKKTQFLYIGAFLFGLSLTHHHMILFLVPALVYVVWSQKKVLQSYKKRTRFIATCLALFLLGLTPYVYVPIAAHGRSILNWDHAVTIANFIRLITRADYGTFVSSSTFGSAVIYRLLDIKAYGQYILLDYSFIGIILMVVGCYYVLKTHRTVGITFVIGFLSLGPLFLFYSSFPLLGRFTLGTYERFLLPSYVLLAVLVGVGFSAIGNGISAVASKVLSRRKAHIVMMLGLTILCIYPITFLATTLWRFWGLPADRTGNNLGIDILNSLPKQSMLLLQSDTPLFTTQYVRYALGVRPDIVAIHLSLLLSHDYQIVLSQVFPKIVMPKTSDDTFLSQFITLNATKYSIFSYAKTDLPDGWYWVPHGLVNRLYAKDALPSIPSMRDGNEALWDTYHNPLSGILSRYNHLMLSDVSNTYAAQRVNFGRTMLRAGDAASARKQFEAVIAIGSDTQLSTAYMYMGLINLFDKQCQQALAAFSKAQNFTNPSDDILLYQAITYRDCVKDAGKADEFLKAYKRVKGQNDTPLELVPQ